MQSRADPGTARFKEEAPTGRVRRPRGRCVAVAFRGRRPTRAAPAFFEPAILILREWSLKLVRARVLFGDGPREGFLKHAEALRHKQGIFLFVQIEVGLKEFLQGKVLVLIDGDVH